MQTNKPDFVEQFKDKTQTKPCLTAIEHGLCKADCCRQVVIPFMRINYDNMRDSMYKEPDGLLYFYDLVFPYSEDLICVYLNQDTNLCQIYDFRPQTCSLYGRTANCVNYDKSDKFIPIKKRKLKRYDVETRKEVMAELLGLQRLLSSYQQPPEESLLPSQMLRLAEMRSRATPVMFIKALQYVSPNLVKDVDHIS
jgi:Fe-S-cluster containining protein